MFDYNENNIYDRCGAIDVPYNPNLKPESTGKFVIVCGEKIPIINYHFQPGAKFSRHLCLQTFLGYIPIESIETIRDIFDRSKYLQDETEWIHPYKEEYASELEKAEVRKLSLSLGKHWKGKHN